MHCFFSFHMIYFKYQIDLLHSFIIFVKVYLKLVHDIMYMGASEDHSY